MPEEPHSTKTLSRRLDDAEEPLAEPAIPVVHTVSIFSRRRSRGSFDQHSSKACRSLSGQVRFIWRPMLLQRTLDWLVKPLTRSLWRVEVRGAERIPAEGPCILVANHESLIDGFVLGLATPRPVRFMIRAELWRSRILRSLLAGLGGFPVARGRGDRAAMAAACALLERGEVVGVFPQGTCLPYRRRPFLRGAAKLALATGAPLVPVCLVGTERALRPHRLRLGFPKLLVLVAPPIDVGRAKPTMHAARELTQRVEEVIADLRGPYGEPAHAWIE